MSEKDMAQLAVDALYAGGDAGIYVVAGCQHQLVGACSTCIGVAIAAAEERGRRAGIEERDELRALVTQFVDMAHHPTDCDPLEGECSCGLSNLLDEARAALALKKDAALAPRDSGPVCDCQLRIGDHHLATCATQKPRDSGKECGYLLSQDLGAEWRCGKPAGHDGPHSGETR